MNLIWKNGFCLKKFLWLEIKEFRLRMYTTCCKFEIATKRNIIPDIFKWQLSFSMTSYRCFNERMLNKDFNNAQYFLPSQSINMFTNITKLLINTLSDKKLKFFIQCKMYYFSIFILSICFKMKSFSFSWYLVLLPQFNSKFKLLN